MSLLLRATIQRNDSKIADYSAILEKYLRIDVGCNRPNFLRALLPEVFSAVKANMVRDRIIKNGGQVNDFLAKVRNLNAALNEGRPGSEDYSA